jgi:hypothetical protein
MQGQQTSIRCVYIVYILPIALSISATAMHNLGLVCLTIYTYYPLHCQYPLLLCTTLRQANQSVLPLLSLTGCYYCKLVPIISVQEPESSVDGDVFEDVLQCPRGHKLQLFRTPVDSYGCDCCHRTFLKNTAMHSCLVCRPQYDVCHDCIEAGKCSHVLYLLVLFHAAFNSVFISHTLQCEQYSRCIDQCELACMH